MQSLLSQRQIGSSAFLDKRGVICVILDQFKLDNSLGKTGVKYQRRVKKILRKLIYDQDFGFHFSSIVLSVLTSVDFTTIKYLPDFVRECVSIHRAKISLFSNTPAPPQCFLEMDYYNLRSKLWDDQT